jgi:hypothetical protein
MTASCSARLESGGAAQDDGLFTLVIRWLPKSGVATQQAQPIEVWNWVCSPLAIASSVSWAAEEEEGTPRPDLVVGASSVIHAVTGIQRRERTPERRHTLFSRAG